jgi:hypothetical protein
MDDCSHHPRSLCRGKTYERAANNVDKITLHILQTALGVAMLYIMTVRFIACLRLLSDFYARNAPILLLILLHTGLLQSLIKDNLLAPMGHRLA